ncbi:hypothetical protein C8R43DRAFT_1137239 [Mycena crocata]|nr:hypothetical protein C8R43DRAFT_1137239 [Mycena crocata]
MSTHESATSEATSMHPPKGDTSPAIVAAAGDDMPAPSAAVVSSLQKGENMKDIDFFSLPALTSRTVLPSVISYDISCAWGKPRGRRIDLFWCHTMSSSLYRCTPPFYPDPGQPLQPQPGQKLYLISGRGARRPGIYTSWPSAGPQYTGVPNANCKKFFNFSVLLSAWHARCDDGEHDHPANPALRSGGRVPVYVISSRSPTPEGSPPAYQRSPAQAAASSSHRDHLPSPSPSPPPSSPAGDAQAASLDSTAGVAVMSYGVRVDGQGEIFTTAAEARRSFQMLQQAGRNPSLMITESVDVCMRWIEETPWDGVASGQSQSWAEGEDRARRERVRERVASQVASQRVREERRRHILVALDAERADRDEDSSDGNESVGSDTSRSTADLETELEYRAARSAWRRLSS